MYSAIKSNADRIAQEAYKVWLESGNYEALIKKRCEEHNMSEWVSTVKDALTLIIKNAYLNSR